MIMTFSKLSRKTLVQGTAGFLVAVALFALALFALPDSAAALDRKTIVFAHTKRDDAFAGMVGKYVAEFEAANPDIKVEVRHGDQPTRKHMVLAFNIGTAADVVFMTKFDQTDHFLDLRPYLEQPDTFLSVHKDSFKHLSSADAPDAVNGFIWNKTLNLPFVNVSLFRQAGVPVPQPGATLTQIISASAQVAEATGARYPFAIDKSAHRLTGVAYSYGSYLTRDDRITFPDKAAVRLIGDMAGWVQSGAFPMDVWGYGAGTGKINLKEEFAAGNLVTYYSGNWQINGFSELIGNRFEWTALDAPCGPADCFPMPGGDALVGYRNTRHPQAVARFIEFMGSRKVQLDFARSLLNMPGGDFGAIDYANSDASVNKAMAVFLRNRGKSNAQHTAARQSTAPDGVGGVILTRLPQLFTGELGLDEAIALMRKDVKVLNEG